MLYSGRQPSSNKGLRLRPEKAWAPPRTRVPKNSEPIQKRKNMREYKLTIRWTAGYSGIVGNERADTETKKAVSGHNSDIKHLPACLRKLLLINPAALKRIHSDALKKRWKAVWSSSARGKKMLRIDNTTPSIKFLKTISNTNLSRDAASKIAQLRLWHIPLNGYLHRFKRTDNPTARPAARTRTLRPSHTSC